TNVGGLPEIVEDGKTGFVVAPDAQHVADAIQGYFNSPDRERMITQVRAAKARFSWRYLAEEILT
ncbi:MAG: glycosyltransferase, partial [Saprospiraceae bacterium]